MLTLGIFSLPFEQLVLGFYYLFHKYLAKFTSDAIWSWNSLCGNNSIIRLINLIDTENLHIFFVHIIFNTSSVLKKFSTLTKLSSLTLCCEYPSLKTVTLYTT